MTTKDAIKSRGKAVEDSFFRQVDLALLELLREQSDSEQARERLQESTGITKQLILDDLLQIGVTHSTLIAFLLVPLVEVAWADGQVDEEEKTLAKNTAVALGYAESSVGIELLDAWLTVRPDRRLFNIWREYAVQVCERLTSTTRKEFSRIIVERSKAIANATGGIMGVHKTSSKERSVIRKIEASLLRTKGAGQ